MLLLFIRLLIPLLIFLNSSAICAESTVENLLKGSRGGSYEEPKAEELKKAEELFGYMFKGELNDDVQKQWDKLNFKVVRIKEEKEEFILVHEKKGKKRGRGFYLFRLADFKKLAIQSPHSIDDLYTGEITLELALEGKIASAAWNTVPRNSDDDDKVGNSDLAHLRESYFTAYARAFARAYPTGNLIQLHGFTKEERKSKAGLSSDIIVSSGSKIPGSKAEELDRCLEHDLSGASSLYPLEINELGGSTNAAGIVLRKMGHDGFIHIELSKQMRMRLKDDKKIRGNFQRCIEGVSGD
jgi:predicted RNA-binding protein YlxR (DUF448 family)